MPPEREKGRAKLLAQASRWLEAGKNVVVIGPYGIGKTHFCLKLAEKLKLIPLRASVLNDPKEMAVQILRQWVDGRVECEKSERKRNELFRMRREVALWTMPVLKHRLRSLPHKETALLIAEDFLKASEPRLDFISLLAESRFRLVAAVESSCEAALLLRLRSRCHAQSRIFLPRLTRSESEGLIAQYAKRHGLSLDECRVRSLARNYLGYPLMIVEGMERFRARQSRTRS